MSRTTRSEFQRAMRQQHALLPEFLALHGAETGRDIWSDDRGTLQRVSYVWRGFICYVVRINGEVHETGVSAPNQTIDPVTRRRAPTLPVL